MSRIVTVFFVICGLSLFCGAAVYKASDFQVESHFDGRSGDITLFPNKMMEDDAQFILLDNMFNYKTQMSSIRENAVGELIAHMMGSAPLNTEVSRAGFPKTDLFNRPKANLLFIIEAVGADTAKLYNELKIMNPAGKSHSAITDKRCHDNACSLTSMMTSSTPSVHGIIAAKWADVNGGVVKAFSGDNAMPVVPNLLDTVLENWNGKSLLVSGSVCSVTAAALSAHSSKDANVNSMHYSSERKQFVPLNKGLRSDDAFAIKRTGILSIVQELAVPGARITVQDNIVQVTFDDSKLGTVEFDLSNKQDFSFFSEIAFVQNMLAQLQSNTQLSALTADSNPDFFSFGFVGLKAVQGKYGKDSKEFVAAVALLDSFLNAVSGELSSIYRGRLITEVVLMGTAQESPLDSQDARNIAFSRLSAITARDRFDMLYPEIYMGGSSQMAITNACFDLKRQLHNFAIDAYCPEKIAHFQTFRIESSNTSSNSTGDDPNPKFQILLWSGITLALAIISAVLVMCCMDVGKDTIIYRTQSHHPHSQ